MAAEPDLSQRLARGAIPLDEALPSGHMTNRPPRPAVKHADATWFARKVSELGAAARFVAGTIPSMLSRSINPSNTRWYCASAKATRRNRPGLLLAGGEVTVPLDRSARTTGTPAMRRSRRAL